MVLQEIFVLEDLMMYPKLDGTESKTQIQGTTTISDGVMSGGSAYLTNGFDNTGNWEITFDAKWSNTSCGIWLIKTGETSRDTNDILMLRNRVYGHSSGSTVINQEKYVVNADTYYSFKLTKNDTTLTIEVNNNSYTVTWGLLSTLSSLTLGVDAWNGTSYIKNIKVKAL